MSEKPYAMVYEGLHDEGWARCYKWSGMKTGDVGTPYPLSVLADRSVQFAGDFGTGGAAAKFEGTNMPLGDEPGRVVRYQGAPVWETLTNTLGALIESLVEGKHQIVEVMHAMRPSVTGGDGSESIDVYLYVVFKK